MIKLKGLLKEASKPKVIEAIYTARAGKLYKILVDGTKIDEDDITKQYSIKIPYRFDSSKLNKVTNQFKKIGITFTYDDSMDVS